MSYHHATHSGAAQCGSVPLFATGSFPLFCRTLLVGLAASLASLAEAQVVPASPPAEEPVIELSPFVVNTQRDQGYRATSTLAGTRINSNLRDVAAAVTEITPEFIKDVAAVDINDVLVYTANAESTRSFTDAPAQGIGGFADRTSGNSQTANRIRGLNSATLTRNYFISITQNVGFDAYNIDRLSINRGPNSILFGLGDPSGVVNYTPKVAKLDRDANTVSVRYGSYDDKRATVDFNRVLIKDQLALRIAAVTSDRGFDQKPSHYNDDRVNGMVTYKPFKKTTVQASYEHIRQRVNNPNSITPLDHVSGWIAAGRPTLNASPTAPTVLPANFGTLTGGGTVGGTDASGALTSTFLESAAGRIFGTFFTPNTPGVQIFNQLAVSDTRLVPLFDLNLSDGRFNTDLDSFTASWDQEIIPNLYFNVAYLNENSEVTNFNFIRSNQFGLFVDANQTLPDGSVNPHFGETFMPQRSLDNLGDSHTENESVRGTVNYIADFTGKQGWAKWLGRHVFTGYAEHRTLQNRFNGSNGTRTGDPFYLNNSDRINAEAFQITRLRYLGGTADTPITLAPGFPVLNATGVPNTFFNPATGAFQQDTFGDFFALKRRDLTHTTIDSRAAVWQGFFLDDRLVGTFGYRHDRNKRTQSTSTSIDPATGLLKVDDTFGPATVVSGDTQTYGIVAHPLKLEDTGGLVGISFHYNDSENFVPASGDVDIFGRTIGPPSGSGEDYGFSLELFEGKLNIKVNKFKITSANARTPNNGADIASQWELQWFDQVVIPALAPLYGLTHGPADFFSTVPWGDNRIEATASQVSKGTEVELTYNPTPNWRIMANVSRQKAAQSNIAPALQEWVETVLPTWQSQPWWNGPIGIDLGWGFTGNIQQYFNNFNSANILATFKSVEGQPSSQLRKWHANFVNNYTFGDGPLKGWNLGAAARYQSSASIGFPAINDDQGRLIGLDVANAFRDGSDYNYDAWVGYTRKIFRDRINWNLQLNVRDITENKGLKPILVNSDGTPSQFRIKFGPTWTLTSTFEF